MGHRAGTFLEWKAWMEKYLPQGNMSDASYTYGLLGVGGPCATC